MRGVRPAYEPDTAAMLSAATALVDQHGEAGMHRLLFALARRAAASAAAPEPVREASPAVECPADNHRYVALAAARAVTAPLHAPVKRRIGVG